MRDSVVTEVRWGAGAWCCRLQWCCAGVVPLLLRKRMPQGVVRLRMCMQSGSIRMLARRGCRPGCPLRLAAGCCLSLPHYQTRLLRLPCARRSDGRLTWWLQVPNPLELSSTSADIEFCCDCTGRSDGTMTWWEPAHTSSAWAATVSAAAVGTVAAGCRCLMLLLAVLSTGSLLIQLNMP